MMRRAQEAKFMPNSYVFPGGVVEPEDEMFPTELTNHHSTTGNAVNSSRDRYYGLKVGAARELFEESGLLLVNGGEVWNAAEDSHLETWRQKVSHDASLFPQLFSSTNQADLASLVYWSNWLTPSHYPRRFDTFYFVVRTDRSHETAFDKREMSYAEWAKPSDLIEKCCGDEPTISLPPPQWYELLRLRMAPYPKLECMANPNRILPQIVRAEDNADLFGGIFPGDYLYVEGADEEASSHRLIPTKLLLSPPAEQGESRLPIHRITYHRDTSRQLDYTRHEIHLRNMEHAKEKVHLFHWVDDGSDRRETGERERHHLFARLPNHCSD